MTSMLTRHNRYQSRQARRFPTDDAGLQSWRIDRILVKSISRFGRNSADCIEAVRELKMLGIAVAFEKEGIDTGRMTNEMYFSMYSAFSQEESTSIAKNMRKGAVMRMKNGTYRLSQAPYGYRLDEKGGFLICPERSEGCPKEYLGTFSQGKAFEKSPMNLHRPKCQS